MLWMVLAWEMVAFRDARWGIGLGWVAWVAVWVVWGGSGSSKSSKSASSGAASRSWARFLSVSSSSSQ